MLTRRKWYLLLGARLFGAGIIALGGVWLIHTQNWAIWIQVSLDFLALLLGTGIASGPLTYSSYREMAARADSARRSVHRVHLDRGS